MRLIPLSGFAIGMVWSSTALAHIGPGSPTGSALAWNLDPLLVASPFGTGQYRLQLACGGQREHDLADGSGFVPFRSVASASWTAGGIVASAPAVAKFGDAVLRGDLLGRAAREQMTNFQDTGGAPEYPAYAFGMGRTRWSRLSGPVWVASGSTAGFGSTLAHLPAQGITVTVLANRDDSTRLTMAIAEVLIETATEGS
jgi:CubicO group peptidase (beta-lactamase class C family)